MKLQHLALSLTLLLSYACGDKDDDSTDDNTSGPPQCMTSSYVAFAADNTTQPQQRLSAFEDMVELMEEAIDDPALADDRFTQARTLYEGSASFRATVMATVDEHLSAAPNVGMELDQTIVAALDAGRTATTGLDLDKATERVEKTLLHFFFLSVHGSLVKADSAGWDAAYAYWGSGASNDDSMRRGLAAVATERDGTNNTNFADTIFNAVVDGSCDLAKEMAVQSKIEQIDDDMQKVIAYFAGHEAFEMIEQQELLPTDPEASDEIEVELLETDLLFKPLEPLMLDRGGDSAMRAMRIRAAIDAAYDDTTGAWKTTFDPNAIIGDLEDEYGLDIRG